MITYSSPPTKLLWYKVVYVANGKKSNLFDSVIVVCLLCQIDSNSMCCAESKSITIYSTKWTKTIVL